MHEEEQDQFSLPSTTETDATITRGRAWNSMYRDRYAYDRQEIMDEAVKAWRLNSLARQLANLYKIYILDGIAFECKHKPTQEYLRRFWDHPLNNMAEKLDQSAIELFLTGNLFPLITADASGMCYLRIFPSDQIQEINTKDNDISQEISYETRPSDIAAEPDIFHHPSTNRRRKVFMLHFAINRLAGTTWGEGEIWPNLPWLGRYSTWLQDRVRLNHFRNAFMYVVRGQYKSESERRKREAELNSNPPKPGSVLVTGPEEAWGILSASLDSFDASVDGMAIKKMIASGAGVPMHYLSEPESATRTTADASGTPTFKRFENQQTYFKFIVKSILQTVTARAALVNPEIKADAEIIVTSADATERDNSALALATGQIVSALEKLYDRELVDENEMMRLIYRFAGETLPKDYKAPKGKRKPLTRQANAPAPSGIKTDTETGDTKMDEQ